MLVIARSVKMDNLTYNAADIARMLNRSPATA
nr:MAG TPA: hypothetical protein [Caudoviricetes sp.]